MPPAKPLLFIDDDQIQKYDFGPSHPLRPARYTLLRELLKAQDFFDGKTAACEMAPKILQTPAETERVVRLLELAHDRDYVDFVRRLDETGGIDALNEGRLFGLAAGDNPVFPGIFAASAAQVMGTLHACDAVMGGKTNRAFFIGGGLHHAMRRRAAGFCVFNDVAAGCRYLLGEKKCRRVMYIDTDAHHGDGVQWLFYGDPSALTVSLHEDPMTLFPGTGFADETGEGAGTGYAVNVPLPPGTFDDVFLHAFREVAVPLAKAYKPDVIVAQCGADGHFSDPLTHLRLTSRAYLDLGKEYDNLLNSLPGTKFVGVTGGGYDMAASARCWALLLSGLTGRKLPNDIPGPWLSLCEKLTGERCEETLLDSQQKEDSLRQFEGRNGVLQTVDKTIAQVKKSVFPAHGL